MAEAVIDVFEMVEIDEHHRDPGVVALGLQNCLGQAVVEQAAVGQARQGIMMGEEPDLVFGALALDGDAGDADGDIDKAGLDRRRFAHGQ